MVNPYESEICSIHTGPLENLPFQYGGEENTTETIALLFPLPMSDDENLQRLLDSMQIQARNFSRLRDWEMITNY